MRFAALIVLFSASILLAEEPKTAGDFYSRALTRHSAKEYDKAIKDFDEAIKLDPKNKYYYLFRSLTLEILKEYDSALSDLEQVAKIDPNFNFPSNRGRIWLAKKEYEKAIKEYSEAIKEGMKNRFNNGDLLGLDCMELAWIYSSCPDDKYRDGKLAVDWAKKAIEYSGRKDHWMNHEALAAAYAETGDFDQAIAEHKKAWEMLTAKIKDGKTGDPDPEEVKKSNERRKLYLAKKPYRLESGGDQKFKSIEGKFALQFPKGSKVETATQKTDGADMHLFAVSEGKKQYKLMYNDFPEEIVKNVEPKTIFDGGQEGSANKNGGKIKSSKDFNFGKDKFPGRDVIITFEKQKLQLRMILAGTRLYVFGIGGSEDIVSEKDATEFLDSFEIFK